MELFFEIHRRMPREGPGDSASTVRAFAMLDGLPDEPRILDVGCGPGMQTLDLAALTNGTIVGVDNHQPFLDQLEDRARQAGLSERIAVRNADMFALPFERESFDVIWSEGAIYIIGFTRGIKTWGELLRPGGYLAVTEISWLKPNPPEDLRDFWLDAYPGIQDMSDNLRSIAAARMRPVDHFTLPESAWWDHYYGPLQRNLREFRRRHTDDEEALGFADMEEAEIHLYEQYSDYYGYVFYIMRKISG